MNSKKSRKIWGIMHKGVTHIHKERETEREREINRRIVIWKEIAKRESVCDRKSFCKFYSQFF